MVIREKDPERGDFLLYCLFSDMDRGSWRDCPAVSILYLFHVCPATQKNQRNVETGQHICNLVERVVVIYVVNHFYKKVRNDCNLGLKAVVKLGQPNKINKPVREADYKIYKS